MKRWKFTIEEEGDDIPIVAVGGTVEYEGGEYVASGGDFKEHDGRSIYDVQAIIEHLKNRFPFEESF